MAKIRKSLTKLLLNYSGMTDAEWKDKVNNRLESIERTQLQIKTIAMGIAIGMVVAALIFGLITLKEAKDFIK